MYKFIFLILVLYSCSLKEGFYSNPKSHIGSIEIRDDKYQLSYNSDLRHWIDSGVLVRKNLKFYLQSNFEYDSGFYYKYIPFDSTFRKKYKLKLSKPCNSSKCKYFVYCFYGRDYNFINLKDSYFSKIKIKSPTGLDNNNDSIVKFFECKPDKILIIYNLSGFLVNTKESYIKKRFFTSNINLIEKEGKHRKRRFNFNKNKTF